MKNLLAIVTAFSILAPVSGAFAQTQNAPAASHKAMSAAHEKKMTGEKEGAAHAKAKHAKKHKGKKHKATQAEKQR